MKPIKVLSVFDGMACGLLGLNKADVPVEYYGASEIEKHPIMVAMHNNPELDPLGDVCNLNPEQFRDIDLIIGGSPCQSLSGSNNGKMKGMVTNTGVVIDSLELYMFYKNLGCGYDKDAPMYFSSSTLFWEFIRLYRGIKEFNPNVKFFLENVKPKGKDKKWAEIMSKELGVEDIHINSSVVIPQNRDRLYWTNIKYQPIFDKGYYGLSQDPYTGLDFIIPDAVSGAGSRGVKKKNETKYTPTMTVRKDRLANCLTAGGGKGCRKYLDKNGDIKDITIEQAERLQTVPVGYTDVPGVSEFQRFKMLGNGWTIDVIAHFFRCLKLEIESKKEVFV